MKFNNVDHHYLHLLVKCLTEGEKQPNRTGIDTLSLFGESIQVSVGTQEVSPDGLVIHGLPLLTTKEVHFKSVVAELLFFLRGYTRVEYLQHHKCRIWNEWATAEQCAKRGQFEGDLGPVYSKQWVQWGGGTPTDKPFVGIHDPRFDLPAQVDDVTLWLPQPVVIELLREHQWLVNCTSAWATRLCTRWDSFKTFARDATMLPEFDGYQRNIMMRYHNGENYTRYELAFDENQPIGPGNAYWRLGSFESGFDGPQTMPIDQVDQAIQQINNNSRRAIVSAWNPTDLESQALPPCHAFFQFVRINNKLHLHLYQRSCDIFLGAPFNIASYALVLHLVSAVTNLEPGFLKISYGDLHLYENHVAAANVQLNRQDFPMPSTLTISKDVTEKLPGLPWFSHLTPQDFELTNYQHGGKIKADVAV